MRANWVQAGAQPLSHNKRGFSLFHYSLYTKNMPVFAQLITQGFNPIAQGQSVLFLRSLCSEIARLGESNLEQFTRVLNLLARDPLTRSHYWSFENALRLEMEAWRSIIALKNASLEEIRRVVPMINPNTEPGLRLDEHQKQFHLACFDTMLQRLDNLRRDLDKVALLSYFEHTAKFERGFKREREAMLPSVSEETCATGEPLPKRRLPQDLQKVLASMLLGNKRISR